jgi:3-hydroxyacyl-[acyl-carrier-protein] dehydratase
MLLNEYYKVNRRVDENDDTLFDITLLPEFHAYAGHFPGNPISPGVCNIQMIKECAEQLACKRLFLGNIAKCRFSAVLTPQSTTRLQLRMRLAETSANVIARSETTKQSGYNVQATLFDDTTTYIEFKGEFTAVR